MTGVDFRIRDMRFVTYTLTRPRYPYALFFNLHIISIYMNRLELSIPPGRRELRGYHFLAHKMAFSNLLTNTLMCIDDARSREGYRARANPKASTHDFFWKQVQSYKKISSLG